MCIFIVNEGESGDANVLFYWMDHSLLMFYGYQLDTPFKSTVDGKQQDCRLYLLYPGAKFVLILSRII